MSEFLELATHTVVVFTNLLALLVVVIGTLEAFVTGVRSFIRPKQERWAGEAWMRYARWLVVALTLQLGADILETAIAPTWDAIGRLGALAVIRTFLNFFLERDMEEIRARKAELLPPMDDERFRTAAGPPTPAPRRWARQTP